MFTHRLWMVACLCLIGFLTGVPNSHSAEYPSIEWQTSLSRGIERSRHLKLPLLVYVQTERCGFCRKMERNTWGSSEVSAYIQDNFVAVKLDGAKNRKLMDQWEVEGFPAIRVFPERGGRVFALDGYQSPKTLLGELKELNK